MTAIKTVLSIAGSDSSSGAGIQADLKTCASLGTYALTVFTALTAQNTQGVQGILPVNPEFIEQQFDSLIEDIRIDAIKIGMLHDERVIHAVVACLDKLNDIPIVLDPVMVSTSHHRLLSLSAIDTLKTSLIPRASLITPNLTEACYLTGESTFTQTLLDKLIALGPKHVLVKDIYPRKKSAVDVLYYPSMSKPIFFTLDRIDTIHTHGTGCTLSSAIASYLANQYDIEEAIQRAKHYVFHAIQQAHQLKIGDGCGPLNHFYKR